MRRLRVAGTCAFATIALASAACGAFSGTGSADSPDASPNDAGKSSDTSISDAGLTIFEAGDAGFCAANPGHSLCDDFDESSTINAAWNQSVDPNGTVTLDTSTWTSAPQSLLAMGPDGTQDHVKRSIGSASSATKISASASIMITGVSTELDVLGLDFAVSNGGFAGLNYAECYFDVAVYVDVPQLEATCYANSAVAPTFPQTMQFENAPSLSTWTRIEIAVDMQQGSVTASLNGSSVSIDNLPIVGISSPTIAIGVNSQGVAQGTAVSVNVDDVIADEQ